MKSKIILLAVIIISRLFSIYYFGATKENYVKSGNECWIMFYILEKYHMLGFRIIDEEVIPTIFMPTLYAIFQNIL